MSYEELNKEYEELKKEWEELDSKNSGFEELCSICVGSFVITTLLSLVLAIINVDFGYFCFFLVGCLLTASSYAFSISDWAKW